VIADKCQNSIAGALDAPLGELKEFDIVIMQPLYLRLTQWLPINGEVITGAL
jgi:hypothetical protein